MTPLPLSTFESRLPQIVALSKQLVEMESPSTDKLAIDLLGGRIAGWLREAGGRVEFHHAVTAGDHLVARWGDLSHTRDGGILIMCHMDTVYPLGALALQGCREADGRLTGPGVLDMKASIAIALTALSALQESRGLPHRPITFLISSDEEIGSDSSRVLIEDLAREHALVLCMEPALPDGSLKTWRKGVGDFTLVARGKSAHAGADHERGANAIGEMAHHVLALQALTDYSKGTTVNVGVISGGTRSNVIPDECRLKVDYRVMTPEEAARVEEFVRGLAPISPKTRLEVTGGLNRPPMPRTPLLARTFEKAKAIAESIGLTVGEGGTGGGSDANFVAPLGVPVLDGLGAIGNGAHSEREHVLISSLPGRAALLAALLTEW